MSFNRNTDQYYLVVLIYPHFQDCLKSTPDWKYLITLIEKKSKSDLDNQSKYHEVLHGK